ncbi:polyprenyl synthetase family protein [Flavihumibacter petaseus]|uniref:Geranylgeranyl diphosphate synthase n=1 Tax=Flavihumibacter petaseus NBRC 106054 TaxID=1220578 RepID=A0A0E9N4J2_9BACT|nr:polyprenyl synthetase family protein [Flavihumibacter petaseus]GAO44591.1 geranylgeranyl diphosphate synthase [Flavihumibacter petaseus NBRC 106054]
MHSFDELLLAFSEHFKQSHFPAGTPTLYGPANYFLEMGGKRIRPVCVLMGNELFDTILPDSWMVATAIELFHNFTLIHDDIMDKAPLRRGMETVHTRYGEPTALLSGDVMLVAAYDYLNKVKAPSFHRIIRIFNQTARQVCEGQQLDMDFEKLDRVSLEDYLQMITLKTSVLLAASLQLGAVLGGAGEGNQQHIYTFGKHLGISFQIQDDYLDAFGDPVRFGKQVGGDILSNKKTFLLIRALETADAGQQQQLRELLKSDPPDKVEQVLEIYRACGVHEWALDLKTQYLQSALQNLDDIAVVSKRKAPLEALARFLVQRDY